MNRQANVALNLPKPGEVKDDENRDSKIRKTGDLTEHKASTSKANCEEEKMDQSNDSTEDQKPEGNVDEGGCELAQSRGHEEKPNLLAEKMEFSSPEPPNAAIDEEDDNEDIGEIHIVSLYSALKR